MDLVVSRPLPEPVLGLETRVAHPSENGAEPHEFVPDRLGVRLSPVVPHIRRANGFEEDRRSSSWADGRPRSIALPDCAARGARCSVTWCPPASHRPTAAGKTTPWQAQAVAVRKMSCTIQASRGSPARCWVSDLVRFRLEQILAQDIERVELAVIHAPCRTSPTCASRASGGPGPPSAARTSPGTRRPPHAGRPGAGRGAPPCRLRPGRCSGPATD